MSPAIPPPSAEFYNLLRKLRTRAERQAARAWREVSPAYLSESWARTVPYLAAALSALQVEAATVGAEYGAATLAAQGEWVAPEAFVKPQAFGGGWASNGTRLDQAMLSPIFDVKSLIGSGMGVAQALRDGRGLLTRSAGMQVTDAGRVAAGIDTAARPGTGYVRMLNPPSCNRCTVLAGKFYRWNEGFRRHPKCDCVHVPSRVKSTDAAKAEGLISDPYEYFRGLSEADQNKAFGRYQAQAIRDGGDIYQVVNSRRGRRGAFTTEGTTKRGNAYRLLKPRQRRMTPEAIYRLHPNREDALAALREHGYILPGGQVPGGPIRGTAEGFGAMGRGGTRKAASEAVVKARETGVRAGDRYTMTTAERRLYDAETRYRMVLDGRNPFASPGFGITPDPFGLRLNATGAGGQPLTPQIAAMVEKDYRRWLASGGQVF